MSVSGTRFIGIGGTQVARPVNVRVSGAWVALQPTTGKLYILPASGSFATGGTLSVDVHCDSLTTPINAVGFDLVYPNALLQYQSTTVNSAEYPSTLKSTGGSGLVQCQVGCLGTSTTGDQLVASVSFQVLGSGSAWLAIRSTSTLYRTADSVDILNDTMAVNYTLT